MDLFPQNLWIIGILCPILVSSLSLDSIYLDLIHRNISDVTSFNHFYRNFLRDVRQHRSVDTVSAPIDLEKIRSKNYNEDYLKHSCYETAADLLEAHGYSGADLKLSSNDLQSLLPAILNTVENPGCQRQLPLMKSRLYFHEWIFGLIFLVIMKLIHLVIFFLAADHSFALTSRGISRALSNHAENVRSTTDEVTFPPVKYHLWLGLGFNAFTCGLILGTIIYHLIPHIYEVPNEDFDYTYLLRGTVVLGGILLFFIVEKLLRFRFKVDEMPFEGTTDDDDEVIRPTDVPMIQMAKMHGTFHVIEREHSHPESSVRLASNVDSVDEETHLQADLEHAKIERRSSHHDQENLEHQKHNMILYHVIYDFTNDVIYGCGLATAVGHDRFIGFVLLIMIFCEGFRRQSQLLSSLERKHTIMFLFLSLVFLLIGYIIGGMFVQMTEQLNFTSVFIQKEYIYSIVYGALFYTALVTLIPELNDFGQHLQVVLKTVNQTSKQRRSLKALIFTCQNLFLISGILIALIFAIIWRYYNRITIYQYVCQRDPFRTFCPTSF